ncbi:hypothetical protein [Deinococcus ruber]|uniref:Tetratricopeptide repeat protein n=1 Tax=Deinococcus ruber TaxID=1848197 RepID=A0A918FCY9_9DEIO|nr:hypothetical protein [Deinococcus ruber]GGR23598.1 hypothetical protein GCM10008957_39340 [Deinococcus ruber]
MNRTFATLTLALVCLALGQATPAQTAAFHTAVLRAEQQWLSTHPDKSFLSAGNAIAYAFGYLKEANPTPSTLNSAALSLADAFRIDANNGYAYYLQGLIDYGLGKGPLATQELRKAAQLEPALAGDAQPWISLAGQLGSPTPSGASSTGPTASPAAASAQPVTAAPKSVPPTLALGTYDCMAFVKDSFASASSTRHVEGRGQLRILPGNRYSMGLGSDPFRYSGKTGLITWASGPLAAAKPADSDYSIDQKGQPTIGVFINAEQRFCTLYR